jgi:hypothetical protein
MQVCSAHFIGEKVSPTRTHPDYTPSIFPTGHVREQTEGDLKRFERSHKRRQPSASQPGAGQSHAAAATATDAEPVLDNPTEVDEGDTHFFFPLGARLRQRQQRQWLSTFQLSR